MYVPSGSRYRSYIYHGPRNQGKIGDLLKSEPETNNVFAHRHMNTEDDQVFSLWTYNRIDPSPFLYPLPFLQDPTRRDKLGRFVQHGEKTCSVLRGKKGCLEIYLSTFTPFQKTTPCKKKALCFVGSVSLLLVAPLSFSNSSYRLFVFFFCSFNNEEERFNAVRLF